MATEYIPNQPISFINDLDTCAEPSAKYVQIVDVNDVTQFQFKANVCEDSCTNKIDYEGIVMGEGWSLVDYYCKSGVGTADLEVPIGDVNFGDTDVTYITITITSISGTLQVFITGNDASGTLGYITQPGTYTFYTNISTTNGVLTFHPVTTETTVCVDLLGLISAAIVCDVPTNYQVLIKDLDDNYIDTVETRTVSGNYLTYSVDWNALGITSGCYKFCILDPCLNTNGQFNEWVDGINPTEVNSGESGFYVNPDYQNFYYLDADQTGYGYLEYFTEAPANCYSICFTIGAETAGAKFKIINGTTQSGWYESPGSFCYQISNYNPAFPLKLYFESAYNDEAIHQVYINELSMKVCADSLVCNCCSTPIKIGSYDCTHVVKSYCDKDALGFRFCNSDFVPQIRLSSKLVRASYTSERESFEDSMGNKNTIYYKRRRSKNFRVDPAVAEYVHDYLSTLAGYDHMFIDDREYFVDDDEYQVSYPSRNDIEAIVSINVSEKIQLVENKNCGTACDPNYEWVTTDKNCNC